MENMRKMYEAMMNQDNEQMAKMMDQMPMMKEMSGAMYNSNSVRENCNNDNSTNNIITPELKPLFDEWVNQIKEELEKYQNKNPGALLKDIANHFGLSEQVMAYFVEDTVGSKESTVNDNNYEILKIKKTKNYCSLCEDYVKENDSKPIVVLSCEGACLRGEIARKAANILCHSLMPQKTVRLCLGSALTKEGGQRSLVKNAKKVIALEGCSVDCGSRMISGLPFDVKPEVIRTDSLANFDINLFGVNELSEEEINKQALSVARQIADKL